MRANTHSFHLDATEAIRLRAADDLNHVALLIGTVTNGFDIVLGDGIPRDERAAWLRELSEQAASLAVIVERRALEATA